MSNIDPRDFVLQSAVPTVMVPSFGAFEPLQRSGHRFLAAKDGLWIEAKRPGLYAIQPIAQQESVAMPYGKVESTVKLGCDQIPIEFVQAFIRYAREALPEEVAMLLIWDDATQKVEPVYPSVLSSSAGHVRYERPDLSETQHVIADIHSHGHLKAFFSNTDNRDDAGDFKIAIVVGEVGNTQPSIVARLCVMGHYRTLKIAL